MNTDRLAEQFDPDKFNAAASALKGLTKIDIRPTKQHLIIMVCGLELAVDCRRTEGFAGSQLEPPEAPGWDVSTVLLRYGPTTGYRYIDMTDFYHADREFSDEVHAALSEGDEE